jgi:hypothetical protein
MSLADLWALAKLMPEPIANFLLLLVVVGLGLVQRRLNAMQQQLANIAGRFEVFSGIYAHEGRSDHKPTPPGLSGP